MFFGGNVSMQQNSFECISNTSIYDLSIWVKLCAKVELREEGV